jgi:IS5 family transposase
MLSANWFDKGVISFDKLRVDSTVVKSNITPSSDRQLFNDGARVLSRHLAKRRSETGIKIRFIDKRKVSKPLSFSIFNAKNAIKEALYPKPLKLVRVVIKKSERALSQVITQDNSTPKAQKLIDDVEHFKGLTLKVIDQTQRGVIDKESVLFADKIVSLFEEHTDIIIKGFHDVQHGHKINLSSEQNGVISYLSIEDGNTADKDLFLSVLNAYQEKYNRLPLSTACDGGYASKKYGNYSAY